MKRSKITPIGAKRRLIKYFNFKPSDFYDNTLICQDCVELSSMDILEEIQLTYKEQLEDIIWK